MVRKSTVKLLIAFVFVLLLAALVVAVARDAIVASNVSNVASFHELQGIQGADTTSTVAVRKKARKAGKSAEEKELDTLQGQKVRHFQIISAAQNTQNDYYGANERGLDASALRAELERRIPEARASLAELKTLTDRQITLLEAIGGDNENAIYIARSFYTAMETAVGTLQLDDLTDRQIEEREQNIRIAGNGAIATAHQMANGLESDQLTKEEKETLDRDVVEPGEEAVQGLGDILSQLPGFIWATLEGFNHDMNLYNKAMDAYRGGDSMTRMMHDLMYSQGMFSRKAMNEHQKQMDNISVGVQQFLGTYSPFIKTVGQRIGRETDLPAGYGEGVVIRFADSAGRLYIIEEDDHSRILVDKFLTRWDSGEHEVRTMIIYEYDDQGVENVIRDFSRFAPGFERYLRDSRIVYIYKGYRPGIMRSFLYEINFQDAGGREKYHFASQGVPKGESVRRSAWDSKILETVMVMCPPQHNRDSMKSISSLRPARREAQNRELRGERSRPSRSASSTPPASDPAEPTDPGPAPAVTPSPAPQPDAAPTPPSSSSPSSPFSFGNDGEDSVNLSTDSKVINFYPLSPGEKNTLGIQQRAAYRFYERRNYRRAYEEFSKLADQYACNYLSAYWAGESALRLRKRDDARTWYDRALAINPNYRPAADARARLK